MGAGDMESSLASVTAGEGGMCVSCFSFHKFGQRSEHTADFTQETDGGMLAAYCRKQVDMLGIVQQGDSVAPKHLTF